MFRLFAPRARRSDPHFEQEVQTELRYLRSAFPEDPLGAASERLGRRSRGSSEWRVIAAAVAELKRSRK